MNKCMQRTNERMNLVERRQTDNSTQKVTEFQFDFI